MIRKYGDDLEWFFRQLIRKERQYQIKQQLDLGDVISHACLVGMIKKGSEIYNKWMQGKKNQIEEIENEKENPTVFDKLQKAARTNTLFDKFKYRFNKESEN